MCYLVSWFLSTRISVSQVSKYKMHAQVNNRVQQYQSLFPSVPCFYPERMLRIFEARIMINRRVGCELFYTSRLFLEDANDVSIKDERIV